MKRFMTAGIMSFLLLSLTGCWGNSPDDNSSGESRWADGELSQAEVRGNYDISFQKAGGESFRYPADMITLDQQLAMVLRPDQSDSSTLVFDSYDPETGTAELKQSKDVEEGTYTLLCKIIFMEKNGNLVFSGTYTVEKDGVVEKDYAISGSMN